MPRHLPGREVKYWIPDRWVCEGQLHEHRSLEAAQRCEANPNARDSRGWSRGERSAGQRAARSDA